MPHFARITGRTVTAGTVAGVLNRTSNKEVRIALTHRDSYGNVVLVASESSLDDFLLTFQNDTAGAYRAEPVSETIARRMFEALDEAWPY